MCICTSLDVGRRTNWGFRPNFPFSSERERGRRCEDQRFDGASRSRVLLSLLLLKRASIDRELGRCVFGGAKDACARQCRSKIHQINYGYLKMSRIAPSPGSGVSIQISQNEYCAFLLCYWARRLSVLAALMGSALFAYRPRNSRSMGRGPVDGIPPLHIPPPPAPANIYSTYSTVQYTILLPSSATSGARWRDEQLKSFLTLRFDAAFVSSHMTGGA